jgi:hypothetical protein
MLNRGSIKIALLLLVAVGYWAVCLVPYDFMVARHVVNQAQWLSDGTLSFPGPGIARTPKALAWLEKAQNISRLSVVVSVRTDLPGQTGPARILTISGGNHVRNLTLGQEGSDLVLRIRRPGSTENGTPAYRVADVFRTRDWRDIEVRLDDNRLTLAVDGATHVTGFLPRSALQTWDDSFPLAMGNELPAGAPPYGRAWIGEIRKALVEVDGRVIDYMDPAAVTLPRDWWDIGPPDYPIDLSRISAYDIAINLIGFMPFGAMLMSLYGYRLSIFTIMALGALLSLSIEVLQVSIPSRHPSLIDLIVNTAGAGLGAYLIRHVSRHKSSPNAPG